jgi:protein-S-isoprenylcysteine O-methyltransferase Ste14
MNTKSEKRRQLGLKSILMTLMGFIVLATFFFLPAGTLNYGEAWVYLAILFIPMIGAMVYLLNRDLDLLEHRLNLNERREQQKGIIKWALLIFILAFLLPGFDRRFGWSHLPDWLVVTSDVLVLAGYGIFFLVMRENSYASRTIEIQDNQKVISTGPYAIVRHPMYVGVLLLYIFSPLALGSWVALIPMLGMIPFIVLRIQDEEKALLADLDGYREYTQNVRYRLIPGIW